MRHAALWALEDLEAPKDSKLCQWVDASTIFLNKDGYFSFKMIDERSLRVHTLKASLFMLNLFSSPRLKASEEEQQRLHHARRKLLVSVLAHAWLWGRLKVLDNNGKPVAFENRRVLAPEKILEFLSDTRVHTMGCRCENVRDFLKEVPPVPLREDTSKWNMMGIIACLKWDKSHNLHAPGPWCSCRLEQETPSPPPYLEQETLSPPPYHEVYLTKN